MEIILQYVRELYSLDMDNVNNKKLIGRLIIIGVLFPAQILMWIFGVGIGQYIYMPLAVFINTHSNSNYIRTSDFWGTYLDGAGIFSLCILLYTFFWLTLRIKPHFDMLVSLTAVVLILHKDLVRAYVGFLKGFSFSIAWNYAHASILFAVFCGAVILTKYFSIKKYIFCILISTVISFVLGLAISKEIWQSIAGVL